MKKIFKIQVDDLRALVIVAQSPLTYENPRRTIFYRTTDRKLFLEVEYLLPPPLVDKPKEGFFEIDMDDYKKLMTEFEDLLLTDAGKAWALTELKSV